MRQAEMCVCVGVCIDECTHMYVRIRRITRCTYMYSEKFFESRHSSTLHEGYMGLLVFEPSKT